MKLHFTLCKKNVEIPIKLCKIRIELCKLFDQPFFAKDRRSSFCHFCNLTDMAIIKTLRMKGQMEIFKVYFCMNIHVIV